MYQRPFSLRWACWLVILGPLGCGGTTVAEPPRRDAAPDSTAPTDGGTHDATRDSARDATRGDVTVDASRPPPHDATTADAFACPAPLAVCPGPDGGASICVDVNASAQNCGGCGTPCLVGDVCNGGMCLGECTTGLLACDGACIDPTTSVSHCGASGLCLAEDVGVACDASSACVGGVCVPLCDGGECGTCPPNLTACSAGCTDVTRDPVNCGACGHDCLGGGCELSLCQPVVLAAGGSWPIAIDAVSVYFQGRGSDDVVVMSVPKTGGVAVAITTVPIDGGTEPMFPSPLVSVHALAVSATDAYFLTTATKLQTGPTLEGILTAPLAGGPRASFVPENEVGDQGPTAGPNPDLGALAVDGANLYFTGSNGVGFAPLAGGPVTYLAGGTPDVDGGVLGGGNALVVGSTQVIWGTIFGVFSVPKAGGTTSTLAAPPAMERNAYPGVAGVAQDGVNVYWADPTAGLIVAEPLAGGAVSVLASGRSSPGQLATDGHVIVWSDLDGLFEVPVGGGVVVQVSSQGTFSPVAMDATRVYFVTGAGVVSVAR